MLSKEISAILREDIFALTGLNEAIYDHTKKIAREIDTLMSKIKTKKHKSFKNDIELLKQVEQALVSLISEYHFELTATEIRTETAHEDILFEKRKKTLDHLFDLLHKERRSLSNRRTGKDHRRSNDPNHTVLSDDEERTKDPGKNRKIPLNLSS